MLNINQIIIFIFIFQPKSLVNKNSLSLDLSSKFYIVKSFLKDLCINILYVRKIYNISIKYKYINLTWKNLLGIAL